MKKIICVWIALILVSPIAMAFWSGGTYDYFDPDVDYDENSGVLTAIVKNDYGGDLFVSMTLKGPQDQVWYDDAVNLKDGETKEIQLRPKEPGMATLRFFVMSPDGVKAPEVVDYNIPVNSVPFFQATWFEYLVILAILCIIVLFVRMRRKK